MRHWQQVVELYASKALTVDRNFAASMSIVGVVAHFAYTVAMHSFRETRMEKQVNSTVPSGFVSKPKGIRPPTWQIPAAPPSEYCNHESRIVVPFTEELAVCSHCGGKGSRPCIAHFLTHTHTHTHSLSLSLSLFLSLSLPLYVAVCLSLTYTHSLSCFHCHSLSFSLYLSRELFELLDGCNSL
jgi:hypothetical protein